MEHRTFLQSLSKEQRRELTARSNWHALLRLLLLVFCIVVCSAAILSSLFYTPFWIVIQGLLLVSLFHLMHECIHDTVFTKRWPNRLVAYVCGFILFLPANWFRCFHHAHHRYTQHPDKDPELSSPKPSALPQWLAHVSGVTTWYSQVRLLMQALVKPCRESYIKKDNEEPVRLEMLVMIAGYIVLLLLSVVSKNAVLLSVWIIPLMVGQPFLRLYLLAEHAGCESGSNMLRNTRTVLTNPVMRWSTWNMPYHTEHHVYPTVPFHQLPKLHTLLRAHLIEINAGYIEFNRQYAAQITSRKEA